MFLHLFSIVFARCNAEDLKMLHFAVDIIQWK